MERYIDTSNNRRTTYDNDNSGNFDISGINHLLSYSQYSNILNPLNAVCPITHDEIINTDEVIMINQCRHIFKKEPLLNWLQFRQSCPCCRITLH